MIYAAISALKERDGSSKRAIAKYIEKAYPNLPPTHSALLTHHLKRLKNAGHLVMVKKSYKLPPRSDPVTNILPSNDVVYNNNNNNNYNPSAAGSAAAVSPGRGRGRPRKTNSGAPSGLVAVTAAGIDTPKRGRGRPKKTDGPVQRGPIKRKSGRPKKPKTVKGLQVLQQQQTQQDQLNNVTVSYVTSDANVHVPVPVPVPGVARRRGRPKKIGITVVGAAAGGKRPRGRPAKQLQSSIGRPVGRPKKNLSSALTEAAQAQAQAIADLKRKLEFFQSKVKQVVTVLKPQITCENQISAISAGAAIQELEGLASLDINIPLKEDSQPPVLQS